MRITPDTPGYPAKLLTLYDPPSLTVSAPLEATGKVVAIVGTRRPSDEARRFAGELAAQFAERGVTIVSGGAEGIDRAAHEGALGAGGTTWLVAPFGRQNPSPRANRDLYERIERSPPSVMVWPFADHARFTGDRAKARNKFLVALADAVVVVQAHLRSGSQNAMRLAYETGRTLWAVPGPLWDYRFSGANRAILAGRARPLWDVDELFASLDLPLLEQGQQEEEEGEEQTAFSWCRSPEPQPQRKAHPLEAPPEPRRTLPDPSWSAAEKAVISAISDTPTHVERITGRAGVAVPAVLSALLTLTTKNVVVEGPDGFFRLK